MFNWLPYLVGCFLWCRSSCQRLSGPVWAVGSAELLLALGREVSLIWGVLLVDRLNFRRARGLTQVVHLMLDRLCLYLTEGLSHMLGLAAG